MSLICASSVKYAKFDLVFLVKTEDENPKMKKQISWRNLCVLSFGVLATGCQATAWTEKISIEQKNLPQECAGWEEIDIRTRTTYVLMREDPKLAMAIDAHNLKGRNLGCWQ